MLNNVIAHFIQEFYGKDILCYCQILAREKKFKTNEDEAFYLANEVFSTVIVTIELEKLGKANVYNYFVLFLSWEIIITNHFMTGPPQETLNFAYSETSH